MTDALGIARDYFKFSNSSDLAAIKNLFTASTTYSSPATGLYLGKDAIMAMQEKFHDSFTTLNWTVDMMSEEKSGIVRIDYDFTGKLRDGTSTHSSGSEYIIVYRGKIQHIEIRPKTT